MIGICLAKLLFADLSRLEQIGRGMRLSQSRFELIDLWPLALALVVFIGAANAFNSWRRRHDYSDHCDDAQKLFRELCGMHKLDRRQRRLLQTLVKLVGYEQPAQVFLSPSMFRQQLPAALKNKAGQYESLANQLFAR